MSCLIKVMRTAAVEHEGLTGFGTLKSFHRKQVELHSGCVRIGQPKIYPPDMTLRIENVPHSEPSGCSKALDLE